MVHYKHSGVVRVDRSEYFCLNDLNSFYPNKRLDHWLQNSDSREYVSLIEKTIIPGKSGIIAKRGKGGGTYAHKLIAMKFCMWLSKEFELQVIQAYESGRTQKENWNFKRILAAESVKIQSEAVKEHLVPLHRPEHEHFQYSNNVKMVYTIVGLDVSKDNPMDGATEEQLEQIGYLERKNAFYLEEGVSNHQERKELLKESYQKKYGIKQLPAQMVEA